MKRIVSLLAVIAVSVIVGSTMAGTPALAGRSACPDTYVCTWNNAGWTGTMAAFSPSYVWSQTGHCLNFQNSAEQDAISSLASFNGAPNLQMWWFKDTNCSGPGNPNHFVLSGLQQVKDLKGSGWNDTFSSVYKPNCC